MARRRRHEEHDNHEAWAIPYGDLVTLLLAFFVVMYSMSSVNAGKYRVLSDSLNEAFHGTPHAPQASSVGNAVPPIEPVLPLTQVNRMIAAGLPAEQVPPLPPVRLPADTGSRGPASSSPLPAQLPLPPSSAQRPAASDAASQAELDHVASDVSAALRSLIASGQVRVRRYGSWVAVDISTDILFASGAARLSRPAIQALERLAAVLKPWPNGVRVEGHTDDRPIDTAAFPSNWELSAARAASVVHLFMDRGIAPQRLAVLGFGQYRPAMPNTTAAGRNANRRVEVVILGRDAASEAGL